MTSSDFGYKFLNEELNQVQSQEPGLYRPINPPRQGPLQQQREFPLSPEASSSMQYFNEADFIRGSMLPQVFEALGRRGRDDVINEIRGRRRADARRAARSEPLIDYAERARPQTTQIPFTAEFVGGNTYQDIIPGLSNQISSSNEEVRRIKAERDVKKFTELLQKYPELEEFYRRPQENIGVVASRIDPKSFEKYKQYTDLEQRYSDPTARKNLYQKVLDKQKEAPDASNYVSANDLKNAEQLYTSGNPRSQKTARNLLRMYGVDIDSIEKPAFQEKRPIIGGGGYTTPATSEDVKYIRQRAAEVDSLLRDLDFDTKQQLAKEFPGIDRTNYYHDTQRTFYSPTDFIDEIDEYEEEGYKVDVGRGVSENRLESLDSLPDDMRISRNVLRFLRDNPGYASTGVIFKLGTPEMEGMSYTSMEDLPESIKRPIMRFVQDASMADRRAGSILYNSPIDNTDLLMRAREQGLDEKTSSYLRAAAPFEAKNLSAPSIRGKAYTLAGYGPVSRTGDQLTYIDREGKAIPLQLEQPESPLVGRVYISDAIPGYDDGVIISRPAAPYSSQPRFYSTVLPGVTPESVGRIAGDIKRTPSSLLPGAADLIPSAEAIRRGYEEGPEAMGEQMARDFVAGLPVSAAAAPILSNPALAPFAPGIGAGLVGSAVVEAANEAVKQQTGKSLLTRFQEAMGQLGGDTRLFGVPRQPGNQNLSADQYLQRELDLINNPPQVLQR